MKNIIKILVIWVFTSATAMATDVEIVKVKLDAQGPGKWRANVTLLHPDSGWEHYADAWRFMSEDGKLLGTRVLYHPHENEQPFTRSLTLDIPPGASTVYVEAHDKVHGWSKQRVKIDMNTSSGDRYSIHK